MGNNSPHSLLQQKEEHQKEPQKKGNVVNTLLTERGGTVDAGGPLLLQRLHTRPCSAMKIRCGEVDGGGVVQQGNTWCCSRRAPSRMLSSWARFFFNTQAGVRWPQSLEARGGKLDQIVNRIGRRPSRGRAAALTPEHAAYFLGQRTHCSAGGALVNRVQLQLVSVNLVYKFWSQAAEWSISV